jgi:hypothetical protein
MATMIASLRGLSSTVVSAPSARVSLIGERALSAGRVFLGQTTAAISEHLGLDRFNAARVHHGLCCVFVSGTLRNTGVALNPYAHGATYTLEPALLQMSWKHESVATAPGGSVAFFSRPNDAVPWHGAFFTGFDGVFAHFLESCNDVDLQPQTVRARSERVTGLLGPMALLANGESVRIVAPPV